MQKLVFYFPWPEVSGGPSYLTHLANEVAKRKLYEVYYTDYPNGLCEALLEEKNIKILKYRNEEKKFKIFPDEPVILVMAEYWAHMIPVVHPETKIVFFNWHNECIPVLQRDWCATDSYIERFLSLIKETSSVFFCDKAHWLAHRRGDIVVDEQYVPVIVPPRNRIAKENLIKEGERNIAILGRLCLDKIYAVLDLLDNIVSLRDKVKTNVYVIGEGDYEYLLTNRRFPDSIKIIRCGTLNIKNVLSLLARKVDILFAMGTSVLEGAAISLPAVVIPNDIKEIQCNRYPYLFESEGYALGWYPDQIDDLSITTHTIEEIFNDIYSNGKKAEIGTKCYEYWYKNHRENVDSFLCAINRSQLIYADFQTFTKKNINWKEIKCRVINKMKKLYGVTKHRFSILGFPIFTHTQTNYYHSNIYICCLPLLRIKHVNGVISIYILPLVWVWRVFQKISCFFIKKLKVVMER